MNLNAIKQIYNFNKEAGLLDLPYSDAKECAYPIEEALEGFELDTLSRLLSPSVNTMSPKEISRKLIDYATWESSEPLQDVDRLDKHLDTIVFSFGSIFKLGLTPQQAMRALEIVMNANVSKLKAGQDSEGKQRKPSDFVSPEPLLQCILDERKTHGL